MSTRVMSRGAVAAALAICICTTPGLACAHLFGSHGPASSAATEADSGKIADIRQALDEQRLMDAGQMIDEAITAGSRDPRLHVLAGELGLKRGRYDAALKEFQLAKGPTGLIWEGQQGEGIALAYLGRTDAARTALQATVQSEPGAWRAWNALGALYDGTQEWSKAADAYEHAVTASKGAAVALNNRGYSKLLQGRSREAITDFVAALDKKPDFAEARANLRLALALAGDYSRATAAGSDATRAALLNNAGFAAGVRGDYAKAEDLLQAAMSAQGEFYGRAAENLKIVHTLQAQSSGQ